MSAKGISENRLGSADYPFPTGREYPSRWGADGAPSHPQGVSVSASLAGLATFPGLDRATAGAWLVVLVLLAVAGVLEFRKRRSMSLPELRRRLRPELDELRESLGERLDRADVTMLAASGGIRRLS